MKKELMPLNIQLFADSGEENNANNTADNESVENQKNAKDDGVKETDKKVEEKKYTDKELNDISLKNEQKALAKQLRDLGIDDVEKAKSILAKAREEEEKSKSVDEKTQEAIKKAEKATLEAINTKIENALLRKNVKDEKITRAVRLVDKKNILDKDGQLDESKLNTEIEDLLKDFPELISKTEDKQKGFRRNKRWTCRYAKNYGIEINLIFYCQRKGDD